MKNQLSNIIIFAAGAAIGSAVTWKLLKTKYEQIAQEEIDSVKAVFSRREESGDSGEEKDEEYEPTEEDITSYHKLIDENGYVNYSDKKEEKGEQEEMDDEKAVHIISPDDFSDNGDYETMTYYCYQDGVLEDTEGNVVDDIGGMTGSELMKHFGEYEDDSVFLRDDENQRDIEVLLDDRRYSEVYPQY